MAFTAQQMARLSNISDRMLRYWEQTNVFRPTYVEQRQHGPFRRIYSFQDLVSLRTLSMLRRHHDLHLRELRKASEYLQKHSDSPWSELSLRIQGNHLVFRNPDTNQWSTADAAGQLVLTVDLERIRRECEDDARKLMRRSADHYGKLSRNRNVMSNAWVFSGTRIPVAAVVGLRNAGMPDRDILNQYPSLDLADIPAAIAFGEQVGQAA